MTPPHARPDGRRLHRRAVRVGPASWNWRPRPVAVGLATLAVLLVALLRALVAADDYPMTAADVLAVLLGGGSGGAEFVVWQLRMPRALSAILIGAALGLGGAIMQGVARNPLASPDILGVTYGAAVGAVLVIVLGGSAGGVSGAVAGIGVPLGALVGGALTVVLIYLLAWRSGTDSGRLLLVGVGMSFILANIVYWTMTWTDVQDAARAQTWLTGSLHAADWGRVGPSALALAFLVPAALVGVRFLRALGLGDETARGLGVGVESSRMALLSVSAVLVCVATAAAGPIEFVALATPQIALRLCRAAQPPLVTSALLGGTLTLIADQLAASLFAPTQLPVGIFTAILGAPYLMYLIVRRHQEARL